MSNNKIVLYISIAVFVVIAGGGIFYFTSPKPQPAQVIKIPNNYNPSASNTPETKSPQISINPSTNTQYKDGKYTGSGKYRTPAGEQALDVIATIKDSKITDLSLTQKPNDPVSSKYQSSFNDGINGVIVGKSLNENLDPGTINGSSLTHAGFNQAMDSIKQQASSK